jgi:opacity protein-like surface antigen
MKKYLVAISAILLSAGAAQAQMFDNMFDDSYASVLGGWASHPGLSLSANNHANVNDGYNVGARVGTWLAAVPNVTADVDYFYNRGDYAGTGAHLNSASVMGDLMYHLPLGAPFSLYGGGGLGMVNDDLSGSLHGSSIVMGWQAIGGAEYALSPETSLFAEYRYQNAHDANITAVRNVGNTSNNVSLGVKFNL